MQIFTLIVWASGQSTQGKKIRSEKGPYIEKIRILF